MPAGRFREQVTFQRQSEMDDGHGNVTGPWVDHLTVWADVLERLGGEKLSAGKLEASRMATIRVRTSPEVADMTEANRIVARGQFWNIRSIAAVGRKGDILEMLCEVGVAQ